MAASMRVGFLRFFQNSCGNSRTFSCSRQNITLRGLNLGCRRWYNSENTGASSSFKWKFAKRVGVATGLTVAGYTAVTWGQQAIPVAHAEADAGMTPKFTPSRRVKNDSDHTGLKLTLYQYQTCPFCCKVRAFLDYYGISYDVIEVNSVWRTQIKWSKYKKVPILVCETKNNIDDRPDEFLQMNDSSVIISLLGSFLEDKTTSLETLKTYYPVLESEGRFGRTRYEYPNKYFIMYGEKEVDTSAEERKKERKWRDWADSVLVHTLSPNVYRTPTEALQAFNYFSDVGDWKSVFSNSERLFVIYVGATAMYLLGKVLKKRYKLKDDVRESLYDACHDWTKAISEDKKFMGGDEPDLSDLAVYGTLTAIEGCDAFQDLLANTQIEAWFYQTKESVNNHQGMITLNKKWQASLNRKWQLKL